MCAFEKNVTIKRRLQDSIAPSFDFEEDPMFLQKQDGKIQTTNAGVDEYKW